MRKKNPAIFIAIVLLLALVLAGCGKKYTITFNTEGGKRVGGGELRQNVQKGQSATAPELERSGYIFVDWNDTLTPGDADKTVSAIWKKAYTVTFNPTGGAVKNGNTNQTVGEGDSAAAPEITREGFTFAGWDTDFSSVKGNLTVNAKWFGTYLVTFDPDGGTSSGTELTQSVKAGESAKAPEVKKDGYIFKGWDGSYSDLIGDVKVKATWAEMHAVTFDLNGGTLSKGSLSQQVADGSPAAAPSCYKTGYTFMGWSADFDAVYSDLTVTAQWSESAFVPTELYKMASQATVEISTYTESAAAKSLGSGFFIDSNGTVLTNFHVLSGAYKAEAKLSDGSVCEITQILGYDISRDLAIVKVAKTGNPYLKLSSRGVVTGEKVYTLGSSRGMTGTFSDGMVSTSSRTVLGIDCIQISAPISTGNSGGPLLNIYGEVVGVNSLTVSSGQNINFSININEFYKVSTASPMYPSQFYSETYFNGHGMYTMIFDEAEPNDSLEKAQMIGIGITTTAKLANAGDADCYKYVAAEAGTVNIVIIPQGAASGKLSCVLTDEKGEALTTASQIQLGAANALKLSYTVTVSQTYYVRCFMTDGGADSVPVYYIMHVY